MASTAGGFLLGFGLCLLIFSLFLSGKMREIQALSEKLYAATAALPAVGNILRAASMAGLVMIAIGLALIIRARRARPPT